MGDAEVVTEGDTVAVGEFVGEAVTVTDELAEGLVPAVAVTPLLALTLELAVTLGLAVADPVAEDVKIAGVEDDGEPEQAESATEASTVKAPQAAAASLVLSTVPAMVVRAFMEPSSWARQGATLFPDPASETFPDPGRRNRRRKGNISQAQSSPATRRRVAKMLAAHKGTADGQWRVRH